MKQHESSTKPERLLLAKPRGFCAGVDRAIDVVNMALDLYPPPIYVRKEIVHNRHVIESFVAKGVIFVDELDQVPEGAVAVFSAHGVAPEVRRRAAARRLQVVDATCPLVTKVHQEAVRYAREERSIILVGHRGYIHCGLEIPDHHHRTRRRDHRHGPGGDAQRHAFEQCALPGAAVAELRPPSRRRGLAVSHR